MARGVQVMGKLLIKLCLSDVTDAMRVGMTMCPRICLVFEGVELLCFYSSW